ncbi:hypothetical protein BME99_16465 [Pseudomonas protegens]|nr:hypothetical protein BME99_16465 [Pseudomonas protegens]
MPGDVLDLLQQALAQALAAVAVQHHHVMDIHQGPAGKGGEAFEAVHQAHRLPAGKGQHAERLGPLGQLRRQLLEPVCVQGLAAAHGVLGIVVEQHAYGFGMHRVAVTGLQHHDIDNVHVHPRSTY